MSGESPDWPREFARRLHCVRVVYFPFARTRARGGALRGALSRGASDWSARLAYDMQDSVHQDASRTRAWRETSHYRAAAKMRAMAVTTQPRMLPQPAVSYGFHAGEWGGGGSTERDEEVTRNLVNVFPPRMLGAHLAFLGRKRRKAR